MKPISTFLQPKIALELRFMSMLSYKNYYFVHHKKEPRGFIYVVFLWVECRAEQSLLAENTAELSERGITFYAYHICEFSLVVYEKKSRNVGEKCGTSRRRLTATFHYFPRFSRRTFIGKHFCKLRWKRGWKCWKMLSWKSRSHFSRMLSLSTRKKVLAMFADSISRISFVRS
jgi:hypothetical protein